MSSPATSGPPAPGRTPQRAATPSSTRRRSSPTPPRRRRLADQRARHAQRARCRDPGRREALRPLLLGPGVRRRRLSRRRRRNTPRPPRRPHLRGHQDRVRAGRPAGACRRRDRLHGDQAGRRLRPRLPPVDDPARRGDRRRPLLPARDGARHPQPRLRRRPRDRRAARGPRPRGERPGVHDLGRDRRQLRGVLRPLLADARQAARPPRADPGRDGARGPPRDGRPDHRAAPRSCAARRSST